MYSESGRPSFLTGARTVVDLPVAFAAAVAGPVILRCPMSAVQQGNKPGQVGSFWFWQLGAEGQPAGPSGGVALKPHPTLVPVGA